MKRIILVAFAVVLALVACARSEEGETPTESAVVDTMAEPAEVDFETPVVQVLAKSCVGCHGAEGGAAGLSLVEKAVVSGSLAVASSEIDTLHIVHPGHPKKSYLLMKVHGAEGIMGKRMPPSGDALAPEKIAAIEAWIAAMCTPEEKAEKAAAEMKAKKEAVKEKAEGADAEMKAKKEAVKEKAEGADAEMKAKKEAVEEKAEKADAEMKAKKEAVKEKAEEADAEMKAEEADAEETAEEPVAEEEAETPEAEPEAPNAEEQ